MKGKLTMGGQPPFAGLGKLYFCRVEDKDKEPQPLGEAVTLKPGMLTYKDDDKKPLYSPNGFSITGNAVLEEPSRELIDKIWGAPQLWDATLQQKVGRMPRKMKKAYRYGCSRNTKWTRKVANHLSRLCHTFHNAEIVVTKEQCDRLSAQIEATLTVKPTM